MHSAGLRERNSDLRPVARLKPGVPVVAELGPVIVGPAIGVGDQPDAFDLFVAVLRGHVEPQGRAVGRGERRAHHFRHQQCLGVTANGKVVAAVIVPVRGLHVDIPGLAAPYERGRVGLKEICHADAGPMDDLAPALDALELRDQLAARQFGDVV